MINSLAIGGETEGQPDLGLSLLAACHSVQLRPDSVLRLAKWNVHRSFGVARMHLGFAVVAGTEY